MLSLNTVFLSDIELVQIEVRHANRFYGATAAAPDLMYSGRDSSPFVFQWATLDERLKDLRVCSGASSEM